MRRMNLKRSFTAFALAAVMAASVVPAVPASAETVKVADVEQLGAATVAAPTLSLKESTMSGQVTTSWKFTRSNVPEPKKEEVKEGTSTYTNTYDYTMYVLVFNQGDRTKPVYGSMYTDDFGKKVISGGRTFYYVDPAKADKDEFEFTISSGSLTPGKKDVVAYIWDKYSFSKDNKAAYDAAKAAYDKAYEAYAAGGYVGEAPESPEGTWSKDYVSRADYFVPSAPVTIDVGIEADVSTTVTSTSVKLSMGYSSATGYEIYRKEGKKYVKVASVASRVYEDKGLLSKTTYSYKVRPYYINDVNNTTFYGSYTSIEATTTGSALNLKAKVNSKNKVDLTWKKVTGATKYQIYRLDTTSNTSSISKGDSNAFDSYKLIATVKKSKKKYTDKTVLTNREYSYYVKAILSKANKKDKQKSVEQSAGVSIAFGTPSIINRYTDANGNKTVEWEKVYGADGYIVEKYVTVYKPSVVTDDGDDYFYNAATGYVYTKNVDGSANNRYKIQADAQGNKGLYYVSKSYDGTESVNPYATYKLDASNNAYSEYDGVKSYRWKLDDSGNVYYVDSVTAEIRYVEDYDKSDWQTYKNIGKNTTSIKLPAESYKAPTKTIINTVQYRIKAYKGTAFSSSVEIDTEYSAGVLNKVTAVTAANGIKVTWTPVAGAAYYIVYRVPTAALVKNNDIGGYINEDNQIVEYVGAKTPVAVDVAAWNSAVDASEAQYKAAVEAANKDTTGNVKYPEYDDYLHKSDKLKDNKQYFYQNYSYTRSIFTNADAAAGIIDYCGDIYEGYDLYKNYKEETDDKGAVTKAEWEYYSYPVVEADNVRKSAAKAGVSYTYYVKAVMATPKTAADYGKTASSKHTDDYYIIDNQNVSAYNMSVVGPQTTNKAYGMAAVSLDEGDFKDVMSSTKAVKTVGTACFTTKKAAGKPALKSAKAAKGKVTITIKKKVAGADYYKVYRSTKKKGKYTSVGITKNAKTLKLVDSGVTKGKTYFYKVVSVVKNEADGEIESKASAVKKVKAK
ncbi:MAG: hypothetical protein IJ232_03605 [Lachnospiraceae bacterium]|nr:hypothetical protein [Lachnospiraceae bacterium]